MPHRPRPRRPRRGPAGRVATAAVLCCLSAAAFFSRPPAARAAPDNAAAKPGPVVPGYERLKNEAKADPAALGEVLLGELNCLSCHAAEGQRRVMAKGAPDLSDAGKRMTPQYLRAYLSDPHAVKPGSTMPDVFHASEAGPKQGAVEFLVHYLASLGGPVPAASEEGNKMLVDQGRALFHTIGCVACHAPEKPGTPAVPVKGAANPAAGPVPSVPLGNLAMKTTVDQLAAFLLDPLKVRPGSRMPSPGLSKGEAFAIATYLLREQMDNPQNKEQGPARVAGLKYVYYEALFNTADVAKVDPLRPKSQGKIGQFKLAIPGQRHGNYGVKFTGAIAVPKDGKYTFWTKSDDGSMLYIDGKKVVDNDGVRPAVEKEGSVELTAGDHAIVVTYFQGGGEDELEVSWQGPGVARQEIPADVLFSIGGRPMVPLASEKFTVEPEKAQMGKQMFAMLGCANCHTTTGVPPGRPAKALAAANVDSPDGCLSEHVKKGLPQYHLTADQRQALAAAVKNSANLNKPLGAEEQVVRTMAAMNCYACHHRDKVGGPAADRADLFVMKQEFDMGDEGRIPPQLTGVGLKLKPEAMEQIIFDSKLHIRPALATRMPRFGKTPMEGFVKAAQWADAVEHMPADPHFSEIAAKDGRQLVGTKGLGCVNCHGVLGQKSLGMPAPDLTNTHERLRYPWFGKLMHDPAAINPGTRMPGFWPAGQVTLPAIAGGTEDGQIGALWAYLSLGKSMALPAGLQPLASSELVPVDEPILHRTFFAGIGPRAVLVGYPEQLSVAFDANLVRLDQTWRGRFFDTKGMWQGRGGSAMGPLSQDVLKMPPGPAFAVLASGNDPWPAPDPSKAEGNIPRNLGGHFEGYQLDKEGHPTFHYTLAGVDVHEQPLPQLKAGGAALVRKFTLGSKGPAANLYFQAAAGKKVEQTSPGVWSVDGKQTVHIVGGKGAEKLEPLVRDTKDGQQLVVPVPLNGSAAFDVEVSW